MAQLSLGESKWRMVRRALMAKRFRFEECRNYTRHDRRDLDWLVSNGFFTESGDGWYELTDTGRSAADLGLYDFEPPRPDPTPRPRAARSARARKS